MYVIVWEFIIHPDCVAEFESTYGPQGEWARLFAKDRGYRETRLLRDTTRDLRYVTMDFWISRAAHETFRQEHESEYNTLDRQCERMTVQEAKLGAFEAG